MFIYMTPRIEFLRKLPKEGIVAEIGVSKGKNAENIYLMSKPATLYLIDSWCDRTKTGDYRVRNNWENIYLQVCDRFRSKKNIIIIRKDSVDASNDFPNEYFDWVYIDAGHSFESCHEDLHAWFPKIKKHGYITGHDYNDDEEAIAKGYGVKRAVDEFCKELGLRISFTSTDIFATDYAILKI